MFRMAALQAIGMRDIVKLQPPAVVKMPNRQLANYVYSGAVKHIFTVIFAVTMIFNGIEKG